MPRWAELTLLVNISLMIEGEGNLTPPCANWTHWEAMLSVGLE